jgi:hypothetical protein
MAPQLDGDVAERTYTDAEIALMAANEHGVDADGYVSFPIFHVSHDDEGAQIIEKRMTRTRVPVLAAGYSRVLLRASRPTPRSRGPRSRAPRGRRHGTHSRARPKYRRV